MPGFDGTGPAGMGPGTGGRRGNCPPSSYVAPGYGAGRGGRPGGCGRGRARGGGRGRVYYSGRQEEQDFLPIEKADDSKEYLEKQLVHLQEQIGQIGRKLEELTKTE